MNISDSGSYTLDAVYFPKFQLEVKYADSLDSTSYVRNYYFKIDMGDENYILVVLPK